MGETKAVKETIYGESLITEDASAEVKRKVDSNHNGITRRSEGG